MKGILNCDGCDDCCRYTAVEIDRPTSKRDYSDLFWHLMHEGVSVYIGHDRSWNLEFRSRCTRLTEDGRCGDYENRPEICRDYELDSCTRHSAGDYFIEHFDTPEALKAYLRRRKIDFEFRRRRKKPK